jgi:hypothetical protein
MRACQKLSHATPHGYKPATRRPRRNKHLPKILSFSIWCRHSAKTFGIFGVGIRLATMRSPDRRRSAHERFQAMKTPNTRVAHQLGPIRRFERTVPDDATDLPLGATRGVYVGSPGALSVMDSHGNVVDLLSMAGQYHPISVVRIMATGTTADQILALY